MKRSLLGDLLSQSAPIAETWLSRLDAGLRQTQTALEAALGTNGQSDTAPLSGPRSVDEATAELANRMLRLLRRAPRNLSAMPTLGSDLLDAVQQSFPFRDPARWLGLPLQLPIACASLISQEALRGAAVAQFMPAHKLPEFLDFVVETFSDLHVYFSLQYREELAYWQERVQEDPEDHAARWTLGRTYTKCGLFAEAADELASAANAQEWRQRALYECMVALYHAGDYRGAIAAGVPSLELAPEHQPTRYWLWLAAQKTGGYPESVAPALRMEARDGHHPTDVRLQDVAARIGLDKTSGGRGSAIIDHDGNGYLDVVFAGAHAGCSLYRNNGEEAPGTFTDISTGSGLDSCVYGFAIAAGDYNNDGLPDLYISSLGFYNGQGRLMRNNGDGTFTDITIQAGLETWGPGFTATWVDFDGDGWLDLYLANNLGGMFDRKTPNRLFHNNRDGTFTDITRDAGIDTPWTSIGATWGDFRNCGRPDLFVSSLGRAQLFRNNGDGTFADVSREAGIDAPTNGSACLVCDIDNDGWLDIVQFTYSRPDDAISTLRDGRGPIDGSPMRIFRNNRDGTFTNVAAQLGITG
ncbi:MAG: FG-GAP-like repeat-containing protein, partial [Acidobacteriota bacterium]